ncbi:MAG: L-threonylcarbamoyladenylate synthase [Bacteroidota bacterium]
MFENEEISKIVPMLKSGGLIIYPTDTVWGIGCDALNEEAIANVYKLKQRNLSKSLILLVDDEKRIKQYVKQIHPKAQSLNEYYERPLTIIYDQAKNLPKLLPAENGSIAIRIVKDDFCKALIQALDAPLVSTSANFSNRRTPSNFSEIDQDLLEQVDYVVEHRRDDTTSALPSVVVKIAENGDLIFLRK